MHARFQNTSEFESQTLCTVQNSDKWRHLAASVRMC